jgi:hypothetical protein
MTDYFWGIIVLLIGIGIFIGIIFVCRAIKETPEEAGIRAYGVINPKMICPLITGWFRQQEKATKASSSRNGFLLFGELEHLL